MVRTSKSKNLLIHQLFAFSFLRGASFRKEFARIAEVRSLIPRHVRVMALTATATISTRRKIILSLNMKECHVISRNPRKTNIKYIVRQKTTIEDDFSAVIEDVSVNEHNAERTIIFCRNFRDCFDIYQSFRMKLKQRMYYPPTAPQVSKYGRAGREGLGPRLVRRELDSHMTTNQQQHLLTLMAAFKEVKAENSALKADFSATFSAVKADNSALKAELSAAKEATKVIATDLVIIQQSDKQQSDLALASIKSQLELDSFRLQWGGPALTIRMINFSHYQRSGKVWYSPPFYCHPGYKMQLAVYANGTGAGASTHISIALLLMKGEFDDKIPWPVPEKYGSKPHTLPNTCYLRPDFPIQRVLEEEGVRELRRREKFVAHQTVSKRLLNDSIVLKIEEYNTMDFLITLL